MVQIRRIGIKKLKQILKLKKGGEEMIEHITKNNDEKNNKPVRKTHCFHCKKNINSQQWDVCDACKGIVCSCGSCFCSWEGHRYEV